MGYLIGWIGVAAVLMTATGVSQTVRVAGDAHHDFGRIREVDGEVEHTFSLESTDDRPLAVTAVEPACGCTRATISRRRLTPRGRVDLAVAFLPAFRQGEFRRKRIRVRFDHGVAPLEVYVSALVVPRVGISPRETSFGDLERGVPGEPRRVVVTSRLPDLEVMASEVPSGALFDWRQVGTESGTDEDGTSVTRYLFEARFRGSERVGVHRTRVVLRTTHRELATLSHGLEAIVRGPVRIAPERVYLRMEPGRDVRFRVDLSPAHPGRGFQVLELRVVAPDEMSLTATRRAHPDVPGAHRIDVAGRAPRVHEGGALGFLRIRTDAPGQEIIEIPISGALGAGRTAEGGEGLRAPEPHHDFGRIRAEDGVVRHAVLIENRGRQAATISAVTSDCSCITASPRSRSIPPDGSTLLDVALDPAGRQGALTEKSIRIATEQGPSLTVHVSARVFPRLAFDPVALSLGEIPLGQELPAGRLVTFVSSVPGVRVTDVTLPAGSPFTCRLIDAVEGQMDGETVVRHRFSVGFSGVDRVGRVRALARFVTTDDRQPVLLYPLSAEVIGPLRVEPDRILLRLEPGAPITSDIVLSSRDGRPLAVRSASLEGTGRSGLDVETTKDQGRVVVSLRGRAPDRAPRGRPLVVVRIETDCAEQPVVKVPVRVNLSRVPRR